MPDVIAQLVEEHRTGEVIDIAAFGAALLALERQACAITCRLAAKKFNSRAAAQVAEFCAAEIERRGYA